MTPERLGRYEILGELGKGAMGVVYLALDPVIGRQVALKTFRLGYSVGDEELEQFRVRFLREAQSAGILSHPNIVTIHDVVDEGDGKTCFIAMEYVKGTDLKQLMQRQRRLQLAFVIEVVAQIAEGLEYAHQKGVVHRDVKPANIIITADKEVKITDFGIARVDASNLTVEGQLLGTPNYMAPEQIQGKEVDARTDLFSLGVMLYELVTGRKPFHGENLTVVTHRIVNDAFEPPQQFVPGVPPGLLKVLEKALQKDPADRYQRGREMAEDLRALLRKPEPTAAPLNATSTSFLDASSAPEEASAPPAGAALPEGPPPAVSGRPAAAAPASLQPPPGPAAETPAPAPAPPHLGPPPAAAEPAGFLARPPAGRAALWATSAAVLALLFGIVGALALEVSPLRLFSRQAEDLRSPPDPELELKLQYLPDLKQGLAFLEEGQASQALEAFDRALHVVPDNRSIRRLRDRAEREVLSVDGVDLEEAYVSRRLEDAEQALGRREYERALSLLAEVLEVAPGHRRARDLREQASAGLERKRSTQARLSSGGRPRARPGSPRDPEAVAGLPSGGGEAVATATATLGIELYSEISEGVLTIYAGPEQILKESFRFVDKVGLFKTRRRPGTLTATSQLPAGAVSLKIYVYRKGASTEFIEVEGELPPDGSRQLRIRLLESGKLSAEIE